MKAKKEEVEPESAIGCLTQLVCLVERIVLMKEQLAILQEQLADPEQFALDHSTLARARREVEAIETRLSKLHVIVADAELHMTERAQELVRAHASAK